MEWQSRASSEGVSQEEGIGCMAHLSVMSVSCEGDASQVAR
jgi:hypothetical protein